MFHRIVAKKKQNIFQVATRRRILLYLFFAIMTELKINPYIHLPSAVR